MIYDPEQDDDEPTHPKPPPRVAKKAPPPQKKIPVPPQEAPKEASAPNAPPPSNLPFVPVAQMPTTEDAVLNNLIARELQHPSGPVEPDSPTIALLKDLVQGIGDGDVKPIKVELERRAQHQVEKSQLIEALLNELNSEKLVDFTLIEYAARKIIKRAALNGSMTSGEAVVVWRIAQPVLKECDIRNAKTKPVDATTVVNKIDIHTHQNESFDAAVWKGTTPQGREIIRKKLAALHKRIEEVEETPLEPPKPARN